MHLFKLLFFTFIFFSAFDGIGQSDQSLMELKKELNNKDYKIVDAGLKGIINHFMNEPNFDSVIYYYTKRAELGREWPNLQLELEAMSEICGINKMFGKLDLQSIHKQRRVILAKLDTSICTNDFISQIYSSMKSVYVEESKLDSALLFQKKSVHFAKKSKDDDQIILQKLALMDVYAQLNQYSEAIQVLLSSEKTIENNPFIDNIAKIRFYLEIGRLMIKIDDLSKGEYYLNKGMEIAKEAKFGLFEAKMNNGLAFLYRKQGKYDLANQKIDKAKTFFSDKNMKGDHKDILIEKAYILIESKDYNSFNTVYNEFKKLDSTQNVELEILKGFSNVRNNKLEAVKDFLASVSPLDISQPLQIGYEKLNYEYYNSIGNYAVAIKYLSNYNERKDSISRLNKSLVVQRIEAEYNRKQQDTAIKNLHELNIAQDKALAVRNTALTLGSIMLLILSGLLWALYRLYQKNQQNQVQLAAQNLQISEALQQNQMLIKEIHHRVKNNLQVISSLLSMQERKIEDEGTKDALKSSKTRVQSMSILHQNLYQGDNMKDVNVDKYMDELVENIMDTYQIEKKVDFKMNIDAISLDIDSLIPLGLITNELISNSLKHAFVGKEKGTIEVSLKDVGSHYILSVADDGIGFEGDSLPLKKGSLGARLIKSFTQRLDGVVKVDKSNGTKIEIVFKKG